MRYKKECSFKCTPLRNELVDGIDSCGEEKVLEVSQELDKVICEYIERETDGAIKLKYNKNI